MHSVFTELSLIIALTAGVSIIMKLIRQPLILGYILSGLIAGPSILHLIHSTETFDAFSEIGIALLLFIIGLGMRVEELKNLGKVVFFIAMSTLLTITMTGFATASLMGFGRTEALIVGLCLFFSSTIIIVKILTDKKEQNRLHGQIAIGVILFDDLVATMALLFIVAGKHGGFDVGQLVVMAAKASMLILFLIICNRKLLPKVAKYMATNQELLFLFAIAWGFGIASLFELSGFSIEIGALFAGVALASSKFVQEIASRLRPLRDFFIVLFFISLGEKMKLSNIVSSILPAIAFSLIVIILKPIVVTMVSGFLGYTKRVSFKAGINLSQISEFSIILAVLAASNNMLRPETASVITLVAIITIASSTYMMHYDDKLFMLFDKIKLRLFEKQATFQERKRAKSYHSILLGYHHGGHEFIKTFEAMKKKFLVIDYDPEVIEILENQKVDYLYGDATDPELLAEAGIDKAKMIVSTIKDHVANLSIVNHIEKINPKALVICHADNIQQATELYDLGVSYVMIPHHVGSERMSALIRRTAGDKEEFRKQRERHLASLAAHVKSMPIGS